MNTQERLNQLEKITTYVEMVKTCERCIDSHWEYINKWTEFIRSTKHYEERIRVNNRIISRINNRVNTLIKELIK